MRRILSRRRHFVRLCTSQINATRFLLRGRGLGHQAGRLTGLAGWETLLKNPELTRLRPHLSLHAKVWRLAQRNITILDQELEKAPKSGAILSGKK